MGTHSIRPPHHRLRSPRRRLHRMYTYKWKCHISYPVPNQTVSALAGAGVVRCWGGVGGSTKLIYFNESSDLAALAHRSFVPSAVCPAAAAPCCVSWMWWEIYVHVCTTLLGFCTLLVVMMRLPVRFSHSTPIKYSEHFTQDLLKRRETFSVIQIWNVL